MPMQNVQVGWEIAGDDTFRTVVQKGTEIARPELGHSVHADVKGLRPGREYFYRFHAAGETSPTGRTKTAPEAGARVDRLRFGVCGCSHFESGFFTAYRRIAEEAFDFVFHTGDYIYEGRGDATRVGGGRVRHHQGDEIYTLVDYRNRYAQYKSDPDLLAAHARRRQPRFVRTTRCSNALRPRMNRRESAAHGPWKRNIRDSKLPERRT